MYVDFIIPIMFNNKSVYDKIQRKQKKDHWNKTIGINLIGFLYSTIASLLAHGRNPAVGHVFAAENAFANTVGNLDKYGLITRIVHLDSFSFSLR